MKVENKDSARFYEITYSENCSSNPSFSDFQVVTKVVLKATCDSEIVPKAG
jgi:hypothetical protein